MKTLSPCFFLIFLLFVYSCQKTPSSPGGGGGGGQKQFFSCADTTAKIPKEKFFLVDHSQNDNPGEHIYKKIQAALTASQNVEDSYICVKAGDYTGSLSIDNKKNNITLECEDIQNHSCVIKGGSNDTLTLPMNQQVKPPNTITVRGFTLTDSEYSGGISMTASSNIFLSDLLIEGNDKYGITILISDNIHFHNIHLKNNLKNAHPQKNSRTTTEEAELHIRSLDSITVTVTGDFEIENSSKRKILIDGRGSNKTEFKVGSEALKTKLEAFGVNGARITVNTNP